MPTDFTDWTIRDAAGTVVAIHRRTDLGGGRKRFSWLLPDGTTSSGQIRAADVPLYRAETLAAITLDAPVIVAEGEKAADALVRNGFAAVGTVTGAPAAPGAGPLSALAGRDVILWPDHDDVGRKQMARVAERLAGVARSVRVIAWGEEDGDDAFDYFARGGTADGCRAIIDAATEHVPPPPAAIPSAVDEAQPTSTTPMSDPSPAPTAPTSPAPARLRFQSLAERIAEVCQRAPGKILALFAGHGVTGLKPCGKDGWYKGYAEWHGADKDPGFSVHPGTGSWCDHRDGDVTGRLLEFLTKYRHMSEREAAREACRRLDLEWRDESPKREEARSKAEEMLEFGVSKASEVFDSALIDSCADLGAADSGKIETILSDRFGREFKCSLFRKAVQERRRIKENEKRQAYAKSEGFINIPEYGISNLMMADGYEVRDGGIWRRKTVPTREGERVVNLQVSLSEVYIVGRQRDLSTGNHYLTLAWKKGNRWHSTTVSRRSCVDARKIMDLADAGLDVTTDTAALLASYLLAIEHKNLLTLPRSYASSRCMWLSDEDGLIGFMCGKRLIKAKPINGVDRPDVVFHVTDGGDDEIASALHHRGTIEDCLRGMSGVEDFPRVLIGLFASLCPPMLSILKVPNFGIDWCYRSTRGKTTALMVLACVWGNPDPRAGGYVGSWNSTRVFFERRLHTLGALPIPMDETKRGGDPKEMAQIVYDTISGSGKGRGSLTGSQRTQSAHTVLASTGETPLVKVTNDGGTKARILSFKGAPFGADSPGSTRIAAFVGNLRDRLAENYGTIGPAFIRWIIDHMDEEEEWRKHFDAVRKMRRDEASGKPVLGRLAEYVACIECVVALAHRAIKFPWGIEESLSAVEEAWEAAVDGDSDADIAREALQHVCSEASRREQDFKGRRTTSDQPLHGWLGKWDPEPWKYLMIDVNVVKAWLDHEKFDRSVQDVWAEVGWTVRQGKRSSRVVSIDGKLDRMVTVTREAYDEMMRSGDSESDPMHL